MRLKQDDANQVYVWVDDDNDSIELSPHFDYEEDATQWFQQVTKSIFQKIGNE